MCVCVFFFFFFGGGGGGGAIEGSSYCRLSGCELKYDDNEPNIGPKYLPTLFWWFLLVVRV